jgi:hypothetical protein
MSQGLFQSLPEELQASRHRLTCSFHLAQLITPRRTSQWPAEDYRRLELLTHAHLGWLPQRFFARTWDEDTLNMVARKT